MTIDRGDQGEQSAPADGGDRRLRIVGLDAAEEPVGPEGGPKLNVLPTLYVAGELLLSDAGRAEYLNDLLEASDWEVREVPLSDIRRYERAEGDAGTTRVRLTPKDEVRLPAPPPDVWQLLRQAHAEGKAEGLSLNHAITLDDYAANPYTANPYTANPYTANPYTANPYTANPYTANPYTANVPGGVGSYGAIGFGGRQPVTYLGADPTTPDPDGPVVAVFDTGLGRHPWFGDEAMTGSPPVPTFAFDDSVVEPNPPLGLGAPIDGPESEPRVSEPPLQGTLDVVSGHGTFIAGLIRQECPTARILPVRVARGDGLILESDLIAALENLLAYLQQGAKVHVLNLSLSFYHETPDDQATLSKVKALLEDIRDLDCVVVCSAGNEASDRKTTPASLSGNVAVGALNPPGDSVALFSNFGPWVDVYAPGVSLVSTLPTGFEGSTQPGTRDETEQKLRRSTLDADAFGGGFAVWSGTSFAAGVVSGAVARAIAAGAKTAPKGGGTSAIDQALDPLRSNTAFRL